VRVSGCLRLAPTLILVQSPTSTAFEAAPTRTRGSRLLTGGADGNELLTSLTGGLLIVLLAVIGLTIIALHQLLSVHLFVGLVLVGPLALKMTSTGYRFARYYTGNEVYLAKGPPPMGLRLIAPMVVISTVAVMASGIWLLLAGPSSRGSVLPIHKASFVIWVAFTAFHVLGHLPGFASVLHIDVGGVEPAPPVRGGGMGRTLSLLGVLVGGVVLAILLIPEYGAWLNHVQDFHH
jgi:hypothetical protein